LQVAPALQLNDENYSQAPGHNPADRADQAVVSSEQFETPSQSLRSYTESYSGPVSKVTDLPLSREKVVSLAVDNLKVSDFIDYIFANVLHVDFVKDPKISQKKDIVTMNLEKGVSEYRLFSLVREQLQRFGVVVYYQDGVFYVWEMAKLAGARLGFGTTEVVLTLR